MMNLNKYVKSIIEEISFHLNEKILNSMIDNPLEASFQSFNIKMKHNLSYFEFNRIIAMFYKHINQFGLKPSRLLTHSESMQEGLWLIEKNYRGYESKGYDNALYDFSTGELEDIYLVLKQVLEIVKSSQRKKYKEWIINIYIDPTDWNLKLSIVNEIKKKYSRFLHPSLKELNPNQMIPLLKDIIFALNDPVIPTQYNSQFL